MRNSCTLKMTKALEPTLDNSLDALLNRAVAFGTQIGINCISLEKAQIAEPRYQLFIVYSHKLEAVYYNLTGEVHPYDSRSELEIRANREQANGYHTFLAELDGTADGYFNRNYLNDLPTALEIIFHEGFHRRPRREIKERALEEAAAKVVGLKAAVEFSKKQGTDELTKILQEKFLREKRYAIDFRINLSERVAELNARKKIPASVRPNNAQLYMEFPYYDNFNLFNNVLERQGSIGDFVELVNCLPSDYEDALRILKAISKLF